MRLVETSMNVLPGIQIHDRIVDRQCAGVIGEDSAADIGGRVARQRRVNQPQRAVVVVDSAAIVAAGRVARERRVHNRERAGVPVVDSAAVVGGRVVQDRGVCNRERAGVVVDSAAVGGGRVARNRRIIDRQPAGVVNSAAVVGQSAGDRQALERDVVSDVKRATAIVGIHGEGRQSRSVHYDGIVDQQLISGKGDRRTGKTGVKGDRTADSKLSIVDRFAERNVTVKQIKLVLRYGHNQRRRLAVGRLGLQLVGTHIDRAVHDAHVAVQVGG